MNTRSPRRLGSPPAFSFGVDIAASKRLLWVSQYPLRIRSSLQLIEKEPSRRQVLVVQAEQGLKICVVQIPSSKYSVVQIASVRGEVARRVGATDNDFAEV